MVWRMVCSWLACWAMAGICAHGAQFPDPSIPEGSSSGLHRTHGKKNALYMVLRDESAAPLSQSRIDQIRVHEQILRQFYAADSGGVFDIEYTHIIDVPMQLNSGSLSGDWRGAAEAYVNEVYFQQGALGHSTDYFAHAFDVNNSSINNPGFTGFYYGGREYAIRSSISTQFGREIAAHELAHRMSGDHARALKPKNSSSHTSYVWDDADQQYEEFSYNGGPFTATPFGVFRSEYGNRFDILGGNNHGGVRVSEKLSDFDWLTPQQVPDLNALGEGVHRIYAHDEFNAVSDGNGNWGANKTYDPNAHYGLTFLRQAERFNTSSGQFDSDTQRITLEYREGRDGVLFYLDDMLLDLDPQGGTSESNLERELEIGQSINDIDFGMSTFIITDQNTDFLSFNPSPPTPAQALRSEWFHFAVLGTGSDSIGSYIELDVSLVNPLNGILGDLDQSGDVTAEDFGFFLAGWLTDTSLETPELKYLHGDINLDGITDLEDAFLMRQALIDNNIQPTGFEALLATVPEPSAALLLAAAALVTGRTRRRES